MGANASPSPRLVPRRSRLKGRLGASEISPRARNPRRVVWHKQSAPPTSTASTSPESSQRRALAKAFPKIESAYRESMPLPEQSSADSVADLREIVDRYSATMDRLGGEAYVKQWLDPTFIESWPGVDKSMVNLPGGVLTRPIMETMVKHEEPFVVLVKDGIVQQVVDRSALVTRLALSRLA